MVSIDELVGILQRVLDDPGQREAHIAKFQEAVWDGRYRGTDPRIEDILRDLAYDLEFFVADPTHRAEDPSYYGERRLAAEIREALRRLRVAGNGK